MQTVVIVIHLLVVVSLIGVVLLQKSEGGGLGMGGGSGFMTSRGTGNVLTTATSILAAVFFVTSLVLSILAGFDRKPSSIINSGAPAGQSAPGEQAPLGSGGGVLDSLRRQSEPAGAPQQQPAEPQVPASR